MIPKIVHYTWFSTDPYPEKIQKCIDSWHRCLPDYKYILWDIDRIKDIDSVWLKESLAMKKWAYAADYVRLYAIYNYGGIYLDTDCVVYRSFDDLLNDKCFIGKENSFHIEGGVIESYLTSHCFGAEAAHPFIKRCLSYYERPFVVSNDNSLPMKLKWNTVLLPFIQSELAEQIGYNPLPSADNIQLLDGMTVYPKSYFDLLKLTPNGYCRHLALGSWREKSAIEDEITLGYKIKWRIEVIVRWLMDKCGYYLIKKR